MKRILFFALSLLSYFVLIAQPCLPDGITFSTQEELNQFQVDYPDCTVIEGDVMITSYKVTDLTPFQNIEEFQGNFTVYFNSQIENFIGLENLKKIGGTFRVESTNILNFEGLENLMNIDGDFEVKVNYGYPMNFDGLSSLTEIEESLIIGGYSGNGNPYLTDLLGLSQVERIGGDLEIQGTNMLTDLQGLEKIDSIFGDLYIRAYGEGVEMSLENLEGLNNLKYVGGTMGLEYLSSLKNYDGVESLEYVEEYLDLENNPVVEDYDGFSSLRRAQSLDLIGAYKVQDLSGFKNLEYLEEELDIGDMDGLKDLSGLDKLSQIGHLFVYESDSITSLAGLETATTAPSGVTVFIQDNPLLEDIKSINSFDPSGIKKFTLRSNPKLSFCAIEMLCAVLDIPDVNLEISDNGIGCMSIDEVDLACAIIDVDEYDANKISLFPNPAIKTIRIEGLDPGKDVLFRIFDLYGRTLYSSNENKTEIDIGQYPAGIYYIQIFEGIHKLYSGQIQKIAH